MRLLAVPAVALALLAAAPAARAADATVADPTAPGAGSIAAQFVGLSVEWSLAERYFGPGARAGTAQLLIGLGGGVLRLGGNSQDLMPFDATAPNSIEDIAPDDLVALRQTLEQANGTRLGRFGRPSDWGTILGTSFGPTTPARPWRTPANAQAFVQQGVLPAFGGRARRFVTSIGLGNEPDVLYSDDVDRYLGDLRPVLDAQLTRPFALDVPSTSEPIAPWQSVLDGSADPRFFFAWPQILDAVAPATLRVRSSQGAASTDHQYPTARSCDDDAYRCASIERLLSDERQQDLDLVTATHAAQAAQRGLTYRIGETNTASGRGVAGVSDVAASATWALDDMFHAACPQPPDRPGANADCSQPGAIGINFHNAEREAIFHPEDGNAYYNVVDFDPSPAGGAPSAAPSYYALLLFGRFAQGTSGLRPLAVAANDASGAGVRGWRVTTDRGTPRSFLINKGTQAAQVALPTGRARGVQGFLVHRMTPVDPTGAGRTLDAPQVAVDGRQVGPDGRWPGDRPQVVLARPGSLGVTLAPGEAASVEPLLR